MLLSELLQWYHPLGVSMGSTNNRIAPGPSSDAKLAGKTRLALYLIAGIGLLFLCYIAIGAGLYYWKEYFPHYEAGAVASLEALYTMEENFKSEKGGYAGTFDELGAPLGARIQGNQLRWDEGYVFEFSAIRRDSLGKVTEYWITARPVAYKSGSRRNYLIDQNGTIHYTVQNRPATPRDPTFIVSR